MSPDYSFPANDFSRIGHNTTIMDRAYTLLAIAFIALTVNLPHTSLAVSNTVDSISSPDVDFLIEPVSWRAFETVASEGQMILGYLHASSDGSLYPGDEQKYDNWVPVKVTFLVLSEDDYGQFCLGAQYSADLIHIDVSHCSWEFRVPSDGRWYFLYLNPTVYLVRIQGEVSFGIVFPAVLVSIIAISLVAIVLLLVFLRRKPLYK